MFTGIITGIGTVRAIRPAGGGRDMRLTVASPWPNTADIPLGASIACAGCCLTATELGPDWFTVDVSQETISATHLGTWREGTRINLERSLRLGDELSGHLVYGHVDGLATLVAATPENGSLRLDFDVPAAMARFVAPKGSVSLDGVSLTVNAVDNARFGVNIIPHTAQHTTLGDLRPGDRTHLEVDMLARYVARMRDLSCVD